MLEYYRTDLTNIKRHWPLFSILSKLWPQAMGVAAHQRARDTASVGQPPGSVDLGNNPVTSPAPTSPTPTPTLAPNQSVSSVSICG